MAREALRRRAAAGPVPHVHAVQGHERGLARPAGDAPLQARDRSSPPQAEAAAKPQRQEVVRSSRRWDYDHRSRGETARMSPTELNAVRF